MLAVADCNMDCKRKQYHNKHANYQEPGLIPQISSASGYLNRLCSLDQRLRHDKHGRVLVQNLHDGVSNEMFQSLGVRAYREVALGVPTVKIKSNPASAHLQIPRT